MLKCPVCGKILKQHIEYNVGIPVVWYDCCCGYTSKSDTIYIDTKTDYPKKKVEEKV